MVTCPTPSTYVWRSTLSAVRSLPPASDNAAREDQLRRLEELKAVAAAAQMRLAVGLEAEVRDDGRAAGVSSAQRGRGVAGQLGLALRRSPHSVQRWLSHARILSADLPETFAQLAARRTSKWREMLVARDAAVLSTAHRRAMDARMASRLPGLGDGGTESAARALAQQLDPAAAVERTRRATSERCVSIRPVADAMARLSILAPLAQGVAAYAALSAAADTTIATPGGDPHAVDGVPRARGQVMADAAIERLTGQAAAADVPVAVTVVLPIATLLARVGEPGRTATALLTVPAGSGSHPLPAAVAHDLVLTGSVPRWLRRVFTAPKSRRLVQLETGAREFTGAQREFLALRDQACRTPWCDAPVRHADHVDRHAFGGSTAVGNGRGLCAACNYAAAAPGWHAEPEPDGTITTRTPTGHRYESAEPRPPTTGPPMVTERFRDIGPVEVTYFRHRAA